MSEIKSTTMDSNVAVDVSEMYAISSAQLKSEEDVAYVSKPVYGVLKRVFDFCASLAALIVLSPVMLIIALVIYFDDKGETIFSQYRCGKDGKQFKMYKFRTMCVDAEEKLATLEKDNEMDGPVFKIKNDPRITKVGKFLRSSGLDELPQLVNILKGDMSVVGPRPALPKEVAQYGKKEKIRLAVLPGLTCYWQIAPSRNDISFDEWMEMDKKYVQERNLWVDIKIILKTVVTVVKRQGC